MPGLPVIEDAAQSIGARRSDRRRVAHGGRDRDHRHVQLLPLEEPRRLRRRRHDRHAGRRDRRAAASACACTAARSSTSTTKSGYNSRLDALQAAVLSAKLPHLAAGARSGARTRRTTTRRSPTSRGRSARDAVRRAGERVDLQPVHASASPTASATRCRRTSRSSGIGTLDLLSAAAAPSALLRVPRATRKASCPESERAAKEVLSLPIFPELTRAQLDEVPCAWLIDDGRFVRRTTLTNEHHCHRHPATSASSSARASPRPAMRSPARTSIRRRSRAEENVLPIYEPGLDDSSSATRSRSA